MDPPKSGEVPPAAKSIDINPPGVAEAAALAKASATPPSGFKPKPGAAPWAFAACAACGGTGFSSKGGAACRICDVEQTKAGGPPAGKITSALYVLDVAGGQIVYEVRAEHAALVEKAGASTGGSYALPGAPTAGGAPGSAPPVTAGQATSTQEPSPPAGTTGTTGTAPPADVSQAGETPKRKRRTKAEMLADAEREAAEAKAKADAAASAPAGASMSETMAAAEAAAAAVRAKALAEVQAEQKRLNEAAAKAALDGTSDNTLTGEAAKIARAAIDAEVAKFKSQDSTLAAEFPAKARPPFASFTLVHGNIARWHKNSGIAVLSLNDIFHARGVEMAAEHKAQSYWALDSFKRRDWMAMVADKIAASLGNAFVTYTAETPDMKAFVEAIRIYAGAEIGS